MGGSWKKKINLILEQFKGIIQGYLHDTSIPPIDDFGFL